MIVATADRPLVDRLAAEPMWRESIPTRPLRWHRGPDRREVRCQLSATQRSDGSGMGRQNVNAPAFGRWVSPDRDHHWRSRYRHALDPQRAEAKVSRLERQLPLITITTGMIRFIPAAASAEPTGRSPCDDSGHGTHTAGTAVGDDGTGNQVGVAPARSGSVAATWTRETARQLPTPSVSSLPSHRQISPATTPIRRCVHTSLNNSWACPVSEGCVTGTELQTIVNNTQAAGIFVVVSAGNSGSACSTVQDAPSFYDARFQ